MIGVDNAKSILSVCAKHQIAYAIGFATVITIVLIAGYFYTRDNAPDEFIIPLWSCLLPPAIAIIYASSVGKNMELLHDSEAMELKLGEMTKKEYINYKIGDDRTHKSLMGSTTSALILSGSSVLGPFLRGDQR